MLIDMLNEDDTGAKSVPLSQSFNYKFEPRQST